MVGLVSNGILSYQLLSLAAPANSAGFGASTAIGDLDGDAGDEIAVGSTGSSKFTGKVSIYKFNSVAFDNTQTISSPIPNSRLDDLFGSGLAISNVTSTSANDLIVGASGSTVNGATGAGRIFIFPGPISAPNYQTLTTGTRSDQLGSSLVSGNVDGGIRDVIGATSGSSSSPRASVYIGATSTGQSPAFTLQPLAGRNTTIWGVRDSADLNGDGLDDVIAGAPAGCGGTAYLYLSNINGPLPVSTRVAFQSPVQGQSEFGWSAAIGPGSHLIFVSDTLTTVGSSFPNNGQVYVFKLN
jgi:hypothetical protein